MTNFKFYVQSKIGAVKGNDGLNYDTWSFDAKDQADADKKMAALVKKEGLDPSKVMKMYRAEMFDVVNGDHFFLEIESHSRSLAYLKAGQEWPRCTVVTCKLFEDVK